MAKRISDTLVETTTDEFDHILMWDTQDKELKRATADVVFANTQLQPDWNESNTASPRYINNKPVDPGDTNVTAVALNTTGNTLDITLTRTAPLSSLSTSVELPDYNAIKELEGMSIVNQSPTTTGSAGIITVEFGAGGTSVDGNITLSNTGVFTVSPADYSYKAEAVLRTGRTGTGGDAYVVLWMEKSSDGGSTWSQSSPTRFILLPDSSRVSFQENAILFPSEPTETLYRFRCARDATGVNQGGLLSAVATGTLNYLNTSPSASIMITKIGV